MRTRTLKSTLLFLIFGVGVSALLSYLIYQKVLQPARVREDAFAAYVDGRLSADAKGMVVLPPEWAMASIDGKMYATRETTGTRWALFVQERGEGAKLRGYAFCDRPAAARVATDVELNYPVPPSATPGTTSRPGRDTVILRIKRVLNPSCFEVVNDKK